METIIICSFYLLLSLNIISGLILIPYPINMLLLAISSRNWVDPVAKSHYKDNELPSVTIQLPVYNESKVIKSTLTEITKLLYPKNLLKFQVLDDSTDHTSSIISSEVAKLTNKGFNFEIIHRENRDGYKAGALENGIKSITSEFIAIFDADFQVNPLFLEQIIHYFKSNERIGAVNARWDHSNLDFSLFTKAMSIGLDQHFLVEKPGRKQRNAFMNFNGTGGVWRKSVIEQSGGWSSRTLAEDLDLAYRAQMLGFDILYIRDATNRQEIPPTLRCWIIQQSRWSKGFSQNIIKNLKLFLSGNHDKSRVQGILHLTTYMVPLMILINTITGSFLLYFSQYRADSVFVFGILFSIATICGIITYMITIVRANRPLWHMLLIPLFLFWGAGLIVRMGFGTITGLFFQGGEFVRTPKFHLLDNKTIQSIKIREEIPLDKIFFIEIVYLFILLIGFIRSLGLGGSFLSQSLYYVFLIFSILNLLISEILHAFFSQ